jgi:D-alanyl-D-alanine carboxypeptidase
VQTNPDRYYALGVPVINGWVFTNPSLEGYSGALAYLPSKRLAVIVYATRTQRADADTPQATQILAEITNVLNPDQAIPTSP